jgi:hypothetical protein
LPVSVRLLMLLDARTRTRVPPRLLKRPTDTGRDLGGRVLRGDTLEEDDQGLSRSSRRLAAAGQGPEAVVGTWTRSIATTAWRRLALRVPPLLDSLLTAEANLEGVRVNAAPAEFDRVYQSLPLALLEPRSLDCTRSTRRKRRLESCRDRGRGRSRGQGPGQCSPALRGAAVAGVEAQQVNLF